MTHRSPLHGVLSLLSLASVGLGQWTEPNPSIVPPDRGMMAMTFDWQRGNTVLFGGFQAASAISGLNDTWTYDGTNWTQMLNVGSPPAVARAHLVYDHARAVSVLYGGAGAASIGGANLNQTWEWNGSAWTRVFTTNNPGKLHSYAMAYDLFRQRVVLYGGIAGGLAARSTTWEYDGVNWTQIPASGPGPRAGASMCFHAGLGKIVMFGGVDPFTGGVPGTWVYDGASWTELNLAGTVPPIREDGRMVYDFSRDVCVLYGGLDGTAGASVRQDTWEFDGTRWKQIADSIATPRAYVGLAMDVNRERVVMFGGLTSASRLDSTVDETSELGGYFRTIGAGCQGSQGVPLLSSPTIPQLGSPLTFDLTNMEPATATGFLFLGASDTSWAGLPLPVDMSAFGYTGCSVNVSWDVSLLLTVTPGGTASWTANLPASIQFFGIELFAQGVAVDFAANPGGLVFSNGAGAMIGQ